MLLAHDTEASLQAAVDLVNSAEEPDTLTGTAEVDAWYVKHRYTGRRDRDQAELADLRALRPVLRDLLTAERDRAAELSTAGVGEAPPGFTATAGWWPAAVRAAARPARWSPPVPR